MNRFGLFALILLLTESMAVACNVCVESRLWSIWPALTWFGSIGYAWYLIDQILISRASRSHVDWIAGLLISTLLFIPLWSAGGLILLGFVLVRMVRQIRNKNIDLNWHQGRIRLAALMLLLLATAGTIGLTRSPAHGPLEVIIRFPGTSGSRRALTSHLTNSAQDLQFLREVVKRGGGMELAQAGQHLLKNGEPRNELKFLLTTWKVRREALIQTNASPHLLDSSFLFMREDFARAAGVGSYTVTNWEFDQWWNTLNRF